MKPLDSSIKMTEESEGDNVNRSQCRPYLRRSRTITVSGIDVQAAKTDNDEVRPHREPKSSCQALKHAVSALTRIDDFYMEELGSGFFANVYKATHKATNEEMVMKINKDVENRPSALREVQLMNKMSHPNILRFLGVCVHEGQLHSLTEYIGGGNLEELLANKSEELPWILRIKLSLDIARGLCYVHELGFIHRDLTSRNVLVKKGENKTYTAIVADFGLAAKIPDSTTRLTPVGSPWWIAPEVITSKFYDERADLFSFGIINMELTTRIETDPDVMPRTNNFGVDYHKICELVDYCPLDYLQLAFKCCQVQPERRPSAKLIVSSLENVYKSLISDSLIHSVSGKGHKRSKSEDNILQCNDSFTEESVFMTAEGIAHIMSADDPDYSPAVVNPFANISQLRYGHKLVDFHYRRVSIASPSLKNDVETDVISSAFVFPEIYKHEALSLPSSPIMLRKAAEQMHQVSLRGSDAIKTESKPNLLTRLGNDEPDKPSREFSSTAVDRQMQFRTSRTRSLGCLDFFGQGKKQVTGLTKQPELTGFCNRNNDVLRESSFENILDCNEMDLNDCNDRTNISGEWDYNHGNCTSLASESYKTAFSYREIGGDSTDNSDISLSSCSASSFASVPDMENVKFSFSSDNKKVLHNIAIEEKPPIALQNGSYDSNHFGKSVITNNT